jgi:hypothetical protein
MDDKFKVGKAKAGSDRTAETRTSSVVPRSPLWYKARRRKAMKRPTLVHRKIAGLQKSASSFDNRNRRKSHPCFVPGCLSSSKLKTGG